MEKTIALSFVVVVVAFVAAYFWVALKGQGRK